METTDIKFLVLIKGAHSRILQREHVLMYQNPAELKDRKTTLTKPSPGANNGSLFYLRAA
jgi:hypothetical protein